MIPYLIPVVVMGLTGLVCWGISKIPHKSFEETQKEYWKNPGV